MHFKLALLNTPTVLCNVSIVGRLAFQHVMKTVLWFGSGGKKNALLVSGTQSSGLETFDH